LALTFTSRWINLSAEHTTTSPELGFVVYCKQNTSTSAIRKAWWWKQEEPIQQVGATTIQD